MLTVGIICITLCAYLTLHELLLARVMRGRGTAWGSALCAITCLYAVARFVQRGTTDAEVAVMATRFQFAVGVFIAPAAVSMFRAIGGWPRGRRRVNALFASASLLAALILGTDAFIVTETRPTVDLLGHTQLIANTGPALLIIVPYAIYAGALCFAQTRRGQVTGYQKAAFGLILLLSILFSINDSLFRAGLVQTVQVSECGLTAIALAIGYGSVARFQSLHQETARTLETVAKHRGELKEAARRLEISEQRLRDFADASSEGILLHAGGTVLDLNARLEQIAGAPREDLVGGPVHGVAGNPTGQEVLRALASGTSVLPAEVLLRETSTTTLEVSHHVSGDGPSALVFRDVSHRKVEEKGLLVAERIATYATLAAAMAHEINNPLCSISAHLDLLVEAVERDRISLGQSTALLEDARHAVRRISTITGDLRTVSQKRHGGTSVCSVAHAIDSSLRLTRNLVRHQVSLKRRGDEVGHVAGDETKLAQVFVNLIANAAHAVAGTDDPIVEIASREEDGTVVVEVTDNGRGIPEELRERIFEPLYTTKETAGSGLGLAICRGLLQQMGGRIECLPRPNGGTVMRVTLLAAPPPPPRISASPPRLAAGADAIGTILIVDDDPMMARGTERALARHHTILVDGVDGALREIERHPIDAIVCDLMMPGRSGVELHDALRADADPLADRMIFISGGTFDDALETRLQEIAATVLPKPYELDHLRETVRAATARSTTAVPTRGPRRKHTRMLEDMSPVVAALCDAVENEVGFDRASFVIVDESDDAVSAPTFFCQGQALMTEVIPVTGVVRRALETGLPILTKTLTPYDEGSSALHEMGIRSTVVTPVGVGSAPVGTFNIGSTIDGAYGEETVEKVSAICARFAGVLDRARRFWIEGGSDDHFLLHPDQVLQRLQTPVLISDVAGRLVYLNAAASTLLSDGHAELKGRRLEALLKEVGGEDASPTLSVPPHWRAVGRPVSDGGVQLGTQWILQPR